MIFASFDGSSGSFTNSRVDANKTTGNIQPNRVSNLATRMHGERLNTPYQTKDHFQMKRFQALRLNTVYVYDYPKLFQQALEAIWTRFDSHWRHNLRAKRYSTTTTTTATPLDAKDDNSTTTLSLNDKSRTKLLDYVEIVLEGDGSGYKETRRTKSSNNVRELLIYLFCYTSCVVCVEFSIVIL